MFGFVSIFNFHHSFPTFLRVKSLFGLKFFITQNSSLNFRHSSLITLHSSPKNITISDNSVWGLFGLKFFCMFSIPWLTFMSTHWVPPYQLKICWYRTVSFLPAFSLSLSLSVSSSVLHAHSTPKNDPQHPETQNWQNYQNQTAQNPSIINRSDAHLPHLEPVCAIPQFLSAFGPGIRISLPLTSPPPLR